MGALKQINLLAVNNFLCLSPPHHLPTISTMENLATRLSSLRTARGYTQASLAYAVKAKYPHASVTQQSIQALEAGKASATGYVAELADVLNANTDWLALGIGPRDRDSSLNVADPKLVAAVKLMEPMTEYQKNQALKIITTLAEPEKNDGTNG
jgi:transcriptional regulator with XRE-family HTH domain